MITQRLTALERRIRMLETAPMRRKTEQFIFAGGAIPLTGQLPRTVGPVGSPWTQTSSLPSVTVETTNRAALMVVNLTLTETATTGKNYSVFLYTHPDEAQTVDGLPLGFLLSEGKFPPSFSFDTSTIGNVSGVSPHTHTMSGSVFFGGMGSTSNVFGVAVYFLDSQYALDPTSLALTDFHLSVTPL